MFVRQLSINFDDPKVYVVVVILEQGRQEYGNCRDVEDWAVSKYQTRKQIQSFRHDGSWVIITPCDIFHGQFICLLIFDLPGTGGRGRDTILLHFVSIFEKH